MVDGVCGAEHIRPRLVWSMNLRPRPLFRGKNSHVHKWVTLKDSHEGNRNERQEIKINGQILLDMNHSVQKSNKKGRILNSCEKNLNYSETISFGKWETKMRRFVGIFRNVVIKL